MCFNKDKELENCTIIKFLLMFVIILYHSLMIAQGVDLVPPGLIIIPSYYSIILDWFSTFQNYTFVLISGYIFSFVRYERNGYEQFGMFAKKKVKRLIIPYVFVGLFWMIPTALLLYKATINQVLVDWGLGVAPHQLWFLLMLFETFIVSYLICPLYRSKPIFSYIVLVGVYYLGVIGQIFIANYYRIFNMMQMLLFFRLGMDLRIGRYKHFRAIPIVVLIASHFFLFAVNEFLNYSNFELSKIVGMLLGLPTKICSTICAFLLMQSITSNMQEKKYQCLKRISRLSMPVFLIHQQLLCLIVFIIAGRVGIILSFIIAFTIAVFVSLVLSQLLLHFRITRIIIGE